jgi:hypothetical protein
METFTLIIWTWAVWPTDEIRRPGFSENECKLQAAEVKWPKRARCELEKRQERLQAAPPPKARSIVICPVAPPCWQDGKPIVGALGSPS